MKNLFFTVAAVVALTFTLSSCKKDRTCTCTSEGTTTRTEKYEKVTKKYVRDEADCVTTTEINPDGSAEPTETCKVD